MRKIDFYSLTWEDITILINTKSQTGILTRATIIIAFFSLLSKLTGLLRMNVLTSKFEAHDTLDIFFAAFRVPDFLFNLLILGTLSAAFIPVFSEYLLKNKEQAWRLASSILNLTFIIIGTLALIMVIFAPIFISLVVPGFDDAKQTSTVILTRIMSLSVLFFSLSSVFSSILNSHKKFTLVAAVPVVYNLAIIFGAIFLYPIFGINALAYGVVLGAFLHMALQIPRAFSLGFRVRPVLELNTPGLKKVAKLFIPRIFGMDSSQISLLISTIIGSGLASGSVTFYSLAYDLQSLPLGVVAVSFAIVAFPLLSESFAKKNKNDFRLIFNSALSQILYFIIPLSALMLVLRAQIVRLVLGRGQFGWEETVMTISVFGFFVVSLFAQSLIPLFARAFYAMHNTVIPVVTSFVTAIVNITLAVIFTKVYDLGVTGLAMAFSLAVIVNLMILFTFLEIKFGNLVDIGLIYKILTILVSTVIAGSVAYGSLFVSVTFLDTHTVIGLFIQAVIATVLFGAVYLGAGSILGIAESRHIVTTSKSWLNKIRSAFARIPGL